MAADQEILKLSPHDLAAYADLGKSYDALGDVDQALKSFRIAFVTKFPNVRGGVWDPYAYNRFGELSMQTGDLEAARDSFAAALTGAQEVAGGITPHFTNETSLDEMHALAASAIVNDAKLGDRLAAAEYASKLFPNSVYVECVYGWNLFVRNQFRDAASVYSHAIALASPPEKIKITPFVRLLRLNRPRTVVIAADGKEEPSSNVLTPWNGPLTTPSFGASRIHRPTPLP